MERAGKKKQVNEDNNFMQFAKSTSQTYKLMMKNHFRSSSFYLGNILIPIMLVITLGNLFPINYSFIWMIFIGSTFAAFAAYGTLLFIIKKSTIKKNFDMTATESSSLYAGMFLIMSAIVFITLVIILVAIMAFDALGLISHDFFFVDKNAPEYHEKHINWLKIDWITLLFYFAITTVSSFSISFFFEQVLNTQKNFFIAAFVYLLGGLFFTGLWSGTIYITNEGLASIITVDNAVDENWFAETNYVNPAWVQPAYMAGSVPWIISQVFPHYGINQISYNIINSGWSDKEGLLLPWFSDQGTMMNHVLDNKVEYYFAMPFIESAVLISIGSALAGSKEK